MLSTYFLVSHGSRDPRSRRQLQLLAKILYRKIITELSRSNNLDIWQCPQLIGTGVLELGPKCLHEQIEDFWKYTRSLNINQLKIIPLFLLPGVHVTEDIPAQIELFEEKLKGASLDMIVGQEKTYNRSEDYLQRNTSVQINLCPYVGVHRDMTNLLGKKIIPVDADAWIIVSHGSRRPGSNEVVEKIALSLASSCDVFVCTAYWSVPPDLKSRVEMLVAQGYGKIGILPYFLFKGGMTDAIADRVNEFALVYPTVKFHLTEPIGATEELAKLVMNLVGFGKVDGEE
ncbi:MAG: sirohydrochlorin chelatase [Trichodesmium sp.]